jgi:predicted amidophosphoribosyltransferase
MAWQAVRRGGTAVLAALYPPQCLTCDAQVTEDFALCPACWRDTPFARGLVCDLCGLPLPGEDPGHPVHCDNCLQVARPWSRGRAALLYHGRGRDLVLALKHADRLDLARPAGRWLLQAARPLVEPGMLVAPVPLHWLRLLRRRYNQAAVLSGALARAAGLDHCPDLLQRPRATPSQDGRDRTARFANLQGAIRLHPRRAALVEGRPVLLVDDVMTSGATLAAAAEACLAAGAAHVAVAVLARVAKDAAAPIV